MISIKDALFEEDLKKIKKDLCEMADLVESALRKAVQALKERDRDLATEVVNGDDAIDLKEMEIEEKCLQVIALRQPIRGNLREVFTILKIITDLERMGDEATNVAEFALRLMDEPLLKPLIDIPRMAEICVDMLKGGIKAFLENDAKLAEEVFKKDRMNDELYKQIFNELLFLMISDSSATRRGTGLLFIARFIERFGDHAANIAERVYYMVTGKRIKVELGIRKGV